MISRRQWKSIEKITKFLAPFKELTLKVSASSISTAYKVIPLFNLLIDHVEDMASIEEDGESTMKNAAMAAWEKLVQYYTRTNTTTMLCTALDPRRRFQYFIKKGFPEDEVDSTKEL
jgi:hypothetical protein